MTETQRAAMQQALEALEFFRGTAICDADTKFADEGITALRAALAEPKPVEDPFADLRDKCMGELTTEQADRANELWLREQIGPREDYWYPHLQALFRVIDRLRAQLAAHGIKEAK